MMLVSADTLQTIKTAHDARLLNDKALRELVNASSDVIPKYQVRIEVTGADNQLVALDEEIAEQSYTFDLNCDTLAKWAGLVQKTYGNGAMIDMRLLPSRDRLQCRIKSSEIVFSRKGVYLGDPFKLELENDQLVLREKIDREEMKEKRAELAHTRKIERLTKQVAKRENELHSTEQAIVRQEQNISEAESVIAAQTYDQALSESRLVHLHRRKLNVLRRVIDPEELTGSRSYRKASEIGYHDLLSHDAPANLLEWPQFAALADVIISHEADVCHCDDPQCNFPHAPYSVITYGRDYYAHGFASYTEKRNKLHGIRLTGYRLGAGQQKKVDDFKLAIRNLVSTIETIYRAALERQHGEEFARRVMYTYDMRGTYGNARRTLRTVPRDLASLRIEREVEIEALEATRTELEQVRQS